MCEDEDLATVRGVAHRLGIAYERGSEDRFARDVGLGTEGFTSEDGAILRSGERYEARQCRFGTYFDCEGGPLCGDGGSLAMRRRNSAISGGLHSGQVTGLCADLCYLSQDTCGPDGRLDHL